MKITDLFAKEVWNGPVNKNATLEVLSDQIIPSDELVTRLETKQELCPSALFQWNGGMLTGRVSMPIVETIAAFVHGAPGSLEVSVGTNCSMDPGVPSLHNCRTVEKDPWIYKA